MAAKQSFYQTMVIIYGSLIMGVVMFGVVVLFLNSESKKQIYEIDIMGYIAIIFAMSAPAIGIFLYNKKIRESKDLPVAKKMEIWRTANIIRAALIEAPALFAIVNLLITGGDIFLYVYVAMVVVMVFYFPTKNRVKNDLQVSDADLELN